MESPNKMRTLTSALETSKIEHNQRSQFELELGDSSDELNKSE